MTNFQQTATRLASIDDLIEPVANVASGKALEPRVEVHQSWSGYSTGQAAFRSMDLRRDAKLYATNGASYAESATSVARLAVQIGRGYNSILARPASNEA